MEVSLKRRKAEKGSLRYKRIKWTIFLTGISVFAQLYDFQALLSLIAVKFQKTPAESSYTVSAATVGMAAGLLMYAFIADNFSRKKIIIFSLFTTSFITLLMPLVQHFEVLILLNFVKGLFISGVSAVTLAYLAEEISPESLGIAISFYLAGNTFGGMFGRVVTGLIGGYWGWEMAIMSVGIIGVIITFVCLKLFPPSRFFMKEKKSFEEEVRQLKQKLRNPRLRGIYVVGFCIMGIFVSVYNYLGFKLEAAPYSLPHYLIASIFLMYAFGIVGNLVAGYLSDRVAPKIILRIALILLILGIGMMTLRPLFLILLGLLSMTIAFFSAHTIASRLTTTFSKGSKAAATSLYWFLYYMGSSTIGTYSGLFVNRHLWNYFFLALMGLGILALAVGWRSSEDNR